MSRVVIFAIALLGCSPAPQPSTPSRPLSDLQLVEEKRPEPLDGETDEK
jgi:hypothetical protein